MIVELNRGLTMLIDDEDAEKVGQYKWNAIPKRNTHYAAAVSGSYKIICLHRWLIQCPRGMMVDHINGDGLDNRRCNLRIVTAQQNARAHRHKKQGRFTSDHRGVWLDASKAKNKWRAEIRPKPGVKKCLGCFATEIAAAEAYAAAARELFGEFRQRTE